MLPIKPQTLFIMTPSNSFDDLRRRWQQQPQAPATPNQWQALLASGSRSPITQMLRHVWTEVIIGTLLTVPLLIGLLHWPGNWAAGLAGAVAGLSVLSLLYYYRQLRLLRRLLHATGPLRSHAAEHLRQLRGLLRLGHHANLGITVILAALGLYGAAHYVLPALPAAATYSFLLWFGLTVLASLAIVHWLTKYSIRTAYGQHLDRLEAVLRELAPE